jgi:capsular exopolysaccharide synthesis family protein
VVVYDLNYPQPVNVVFFLKIIDHERFELKGKGEDVNIYSSTSKNIVQVIPDFEIELTGQFGNSIKSEQYNFKIILNENYQLEDYRSNKFAFVIHDQKELVKSYQAGIVITAQELESSVAKITMETPVPSKSIDFINSLTSAYIAKNLEKKNYMSIKTIEYIDNQLNIISDSLKTAEENLQRFRSSNMVMDVSLKSGRIYDQLQAFESEKTGLLVNHKYYEYINDYFNQNLEFTDLIAPSAMGIEDPLLNNMIQELIQLNGERTSLIENNQAKSPYLKRLDIQIDNLRNTISENLKYIINTSEISIRELDARISQLNREIQKLPKTERELFGFERKFNLNDAIYTYLLEKRAEAQIAKASYLPDADIIEPADLTGPGPVSPRKKKNYLVAVLLGLFLPVLFFRIRDFSSTKIRDKADLERQIDIPLLGQVYNNNKKVELVVSAFPKSHIAESFRMLRSSLKYFTGSTRCPIIVVTSTRGQEGKSFVSINLATSLATANFKTLMIGFDLRKPKIYERMNLKNDIGVSSFLSDQASVDDIIQKTSINNLDIITAGPPPPNPAELIASENTNKLLSSLSEQYNYIIIDTPPVGLISDAYTLLDKANLIIYVVRQNVTHRGDFVTNINELRSRNFNNLSVVINDITLLKKTKYGYGYYEQ